MKQKQQAAGPAAEGLDTVERSSLSNQAYQQIRKALMVGELKPGQKLNGREIALRLGTSLTPVREALLQMVAEGVLEFRAGQSITVPQPPRRVYAELRGIRVEVEGLAAERAAQRISAAGIDELAALHNELVRGKAEHDYGLALRCNEAFHLGIAREAGMPRLYRVVEGLWAQSGPFLNSLYNGPEGWPAGDDPHTHVLVMEALRRRDGAAARAAIVQDIVRGGAGLLSRLPE
ncbi:GntR family transcriptional regulator [Pseudoroseomonas ludipueritiae]|uniref:GntR family transcriptional regulator n=1 Tax=Pseudoroseomonas ludipueritiae TaxID=198093 RepID=A0ABR7R2Y6_9PROT|nr:GntR family transcriptional regulator [Pseudoroseomonas ludipueritiae]MBC9176078.1 GntR family transcriptional regulator [Pseudoroseomonas ludipueritiae]